MKNVKLILEADYMDDSISDNVLKEIAMIVKRNLELITSVKAKYEMKIKYNTTNPKG